MRVLVLGGTGFIGLHAAKSLVERGCDVTLGKRDRANTLFARQLKLKFALAECDDPDSLARAMEHQDAVVMAAGHYPRYSSNVLAQREKATRRLRHVLDAAQEQRIRRFVYTGSISTAFPKVPKHSVYFLIKQDLENMVMERFQKGSLSGAVLRVGGCLGPGDVKAGTGGLLVQLLNESMPFYLDGIANFIDVRDVGEAHAEAVCRPAVPPLWHVTHHAITIREWVELICSRYALRPPRRLPLALMAPWMKLWEMYCERRHKRAFIPYEFVEMLKVSVPLSWDHYQPKFSLEQTIDDTVQWFTKYGYIREKIDGNIASGNHGSVSAVLKSQC